MDRSRDHTVEKIVEHVLREAREYSYRGEPLYSVSMNLTVNAWSLDDLLAEPFASRSTWPSRRSARCEQRDSCCWRRETHRTTTSCSARPDTIRPRDSYGPSASPNPTPTGVGGDNHGARDRSRHPIRPDADRRDRAPVGVPRRGKAHRPRQARRDRRQHATPRIPSLHACCRSPIDRPG